MMRLTDETLNGNHLAVVPSGETAAKSRYPDGLVVEEVPRRGDTYTDKVLCLCLN